MTDVADVAADLAAEQDALEALVADLPDEAWQRPTPSPGWTVADQVGHLAWFDGAAALAIGDGERFRASARELAAAGAAAEALTLYRGLGPGELLATWRTNRRSLADAAATLTDGDRLSWYGPSMAAKSFLTARLMECWAHGQDVADALGVDRQATDRLRHVVRLGVLTRGWSYANRGLQAPATPVRLELTAPSGATWRLGPDDAAEVVSGDAVDFCLVVTQRRHVDDTALAVGGPAARDWLEKAQVFAGPPTERPASGVS